MLKILLGCFGLESSTFTPLKADKDAFVFRFDDFISAPLKKLAKEQDAEFVPLILISGAPHGVVPRAYFEELSEQFIRTLTAALPADGLVMSMHGSMWVEQIGHGELELLKRVRKIVGDSFPIAVRLDLHGNIPEEFASLCTVITALRTAPHRDGAETIERCARFLFTILRERLQMTTVIKKLPLLLPGEAVITESEPARSLYAKLFELDASAGVVSASLMVGFGWADTECAGASIIVSSSHGVNHAQSVCDELAKSFTTHASSFALEGAYGHDAALEELLTSSFQRPLYLSDSGDNVTAGAPGDSTYLLHRLLPHVDKKILFAQIWDSDAYSQIAAHEIGTIVTTSIGAKMLHAAAPAFSGSCKVVAHCTLKFTRVVVVQIQNIDVLITEKRCPILSPTDFEALGTPLQNYEIIAVKLGYLMPELRDLAASRFIALTPGPSQLNLSGLTYSKLQADMKVFQV